MKKSINSILGMLVVMLFASSGPPSSSDSGAGIWISYSGYKMVEQRVDSLLSLMILKEKI